MEKSNLDSLEFSKILSILSTYAKTTPGKRLCLSLEPLTKIDDINNSLKETTEAKTFIIKYGNLGFSDTEEIKTSIEKASIGSLITTFELLKISNTLDALHGIKETFRNYKDEFPLLNKYISKISFLKELVSAINSKIEENGEIKSNATQELFKIRNNIKDTRTKIYDKLNDLFNSPTYSRMFQDNIITLRNQRYVIPLKTEFKTHFPCIVYDQSISGETLFVEPLIVTHLNNDLNILISKENREIEKIILEICEYIKEKAEEILLSFKTEEELDLLFSKAKMSIEIDCIEPEIVQESVLDLYKARHPLIEKNKVVPIDLKLGFSYTTLILTGPNTGGKTVTLKTCGLLILMSYCGMHIPCDEGSKIGFFSNILADIGEEQSIEQSLSSFSSHLTNIVKILKLINKNTLVLLDELGAGTDPDEGAALGMAIISLIHRDKVPLLVTTHLSQIKSFAYNHQGAENACVGFDLESLRPTYKVLIGIPGQSHAFQIAKRLGLSDDLIESAKKNLAKSEIETKNLIEGLLQKTEEIETHRNTSQEIKEELENLKNKYEDDIDKFESGVKEKKKKLINELSDEINEIREKASNLLSELSKKTKIDSEAQSIISQIKDIEHTVENKLLEFEDQMSNKELSDDDISIGDSVWVKKYKLQGIIISKDDEKKSLEVQMGSFRTSLSFSDVAKLEIKNETNTEIDFSGVDRNKLIPPKIDLHGLRVEEALSNLDKYLDDAYLGKLTIIYIMHGSGKGILRDSINKFLSNHPHVRDFESKETFSLVYLK